MISQCLEELLAALIAVVRAVVCVFVGIKNAILGE